MEVTPLNTDIDKFTLSFSIGCELTNSFPELISLDSLVIFKLFVLSVVLHEASKINTHSISSNLICFIISSFIDRSEAKLNFASLRHHLLRLPVQCQSCILIWIAVGILRCAFVRIAKYSISGIIQGCKITRISRFN